MRRIARPIAAASLIAAGMLGGHMIDRTQTSSSVDAATGTTTSTTAASTTAATKASSATMSTAASLDAATERAFAIASPSVVSVDSTGVGTGSGVIYDSTGDILTNAHVVSGAQSITVTLSTGKTYTATLVGSDTADDLAVIHIKASGLPAAHFASSGTYEVAETVLAIGSPLGLQESVTSGLISALDRTVQEENGAYLPNALQTSAAINPGNSGGALIDLDGNVVGIPTLEATDSQNNNGGAAQGIGFAIPSDRVTYIAKQIISTGKVAHTGRAYLGVSASDVSSASQTGTYYGFGGQGTDTSAVSGAVITEVATGSPAAQAGMQKGDVITALGGRAVSGEDDLLTAIAQQKPGATVTATIDRDGSTVTLQVHLGELSAS